MKLKNFNDLFIKLFLDLQATGKLVLTLYPQIKDKVHSQELKNILEFHIDEMRLELSRVEKILKNIKGNTQLSEDPTTSIFSNATKLLQENKASPLLDAAIISVVLQIEHLEAAIYSSLEAFADAMDLNEIKAFLDESLREVYKVDKILDTLAKRRFFSPITIPPQQES